MPVIEAICISPSKGPKQPVDTVSVQANFGILGDVHATAGSDRQISFLSLELIEAVRREGLNVAYGAFGENFITSGFDITLFHVGDIIEFTSGLIAEVTVIGKTCPAPCIIYKTLGRCIMPEYGVFAKVLKNGNVTIGDQLFVKRNGSLLS